MVKVVSTLSLLFFAGVTCAHDLDPVMDDTPAIAAMRYCQTIGVRAAWGAQARFLGAPSLFKYIPEKPLKKMFMGETEIPADGIYVLDALDLEQRQHYEEVAFAGWKPPIVGSTTVRRARSTKCSQRCSTSVARTT